MKILPLIIICNVFSASQCYAYMSDCETKECVYKYIAERSSIKCDSMECIGEYALQGDIEAQYYFGVICILHGLGNYDLVGDEHLGYLYGGSKWLMKASRMVYWRNPFGLDIRRYMKAFYLLKNKELDGNITKSLMERAYEGDAEAQYILGEIYCLTAHGNPERYKGTGCRTNEYAIKGYQWIQRAADQGHAEAQYIISQSINLQFLSLSREQPRAYLRQAADQGHPDALYKIAMMNYKRYNCGKKDQKGIQVCKKAVEMLEKSAVQGHAEASLWLGRIYCDGRGVPVDLEKAEEWYLNAIFHDPRNVTEISDVYFRKGKSPENMIAVYIWSSIGFNAELVTGRNKSLRDIAAARLTNDQILKANERIEYLENLLGFNFKKSLDH